MGGHATPTKASCALLKPPAADFPLSIKSSVIVTTPDSLMIFTVFWFNGALAAGRA